MLLNTEIHPIKREILNHYPSMETMKSFKDFGTYDDYYGHGFRWNLYELSDEVLTEILRALESNEPYGGTEKWEKEQSDLRAKQQRQDEAYKRYRQTKPEIKGDSELTIAQTRMADRFMFDIHYEVLDEGR